MSAHLFPARPPGTGRVDAPPRLAAPMPIYVARLLQVDERPALEDAFRLRAAVFADELGWVPLEQDGIECDRCDEVALHVAAFARARGRRQLAGYARVLLPEHTFMLEREFTDLLAGQPLYPSATQAFEVSRFVVHPVYRGRLDAGHRSVADHMARAIARWAVAHHLTDLYVVCEERHIRALRLRGLPFVRLGVPVEYQPSVRARAARLSLPEAAARLRLRRPGDYAWYTHGAVTP
jgi:N-acyl-L-homoserine lactone synthetase